MIKWLPLAVFGPLLLVFVACSDSPTLGNLKRLVYETPGRDDWAQPERVIEALGLEAGDAVADVGSGGGYFTYRFAEAVGGSGRVYAVDVDTAMLAYVAEQAAERGLEQVETVHAPEDAPGLAPASVDLIFLSNVFHHLPDQATYFAGARAALRPDGRIAIVEAQRSPVHFASPEEIDAALEAAGFEVVQVHDFLEDQAFRVYGLAR